MQHLGMRKDQHLVMENNKYTMPPALYTLSKDQKEILCRFLEGVKMPDGFASNIKRCVDIKACKVAGLKTHDYHVILQKLLPLIVRSILPQDVSEFKLSAKAEELVCETWPKPILLDSMICEEPNRTKEPKKENKLTWSREF